MKTTKKTKRVLMIAAMSLVLAFALVFTACAGPNKGSGSGTANGKFDELNTTESVYGFSAASAGMLISSMETGGASAVTVKSGILAAAASEVIPGETPEPGEPTEPTPEPAPEPTPEPTPEPAPGDDTAELDRYMGLVESLLSDGGFNIVSDTSDREGYAEKTVVSYTDIKGNTNQYVMYYNQVLVEQSNGSDDDDDNDDKKTAAKASNETEEEYSIDGVMVIDGADYTISGKTENESESGETESETEFRVTLSDTKYMLVKRSIEQEADELEQEYSYSVFENGQLVERSAFSYETEADETELKMTSLSGGVTETFYFEKETDDGEEVIVIRIGNGESREGYRVRIVENENGTNSYVYEKLGK